MAMFQDFIQQDRDHRGHQRTHRLPAPRDDRAVGAIYGISVTEHAGQTWVILCFGEGAGTVRGTPCSIFG